MDMLGEISTGGAVVKTISIFLALINSLLAGLLITFSLSSIKLLQAEVWWSIAKVAISLIVITMGVATWLASVHCSNSGVIFLGGVFLLVLGAVTIVWTVHLAILSGGMEYYMAGYGGSMMAQGMSSLLGFGAGYGSTTSPQAQ